MNIKYLLSLGLIASSSILAPAAEITLIATGVNLNDSGTYYNIQQGSNPTCWAASGSNVIAHWQENNAPIDSSFAISPEGFSAPQGKDVYNTYLSLYYNYSGGLASDYYRYWLGHHGGYALSGYNPRKDENGTNILDTPAGLGGFYESVYTSQSAVKEIAWSWGITASGSSPTYYTEDLSKAIYQTLLAGNAVVLDIANSVHAVTLWGATFETDTNLLTKVWVTDSSGWAFNNSGMNEVDVRIDGNKMVMGGLYLDRITIDNAHFLGISSTDTMNFIKSGLSIPEPSAFGLLAGIFVLGLAGTRRTRR